MKPIYLDHNATTKMEQSAESALLLSFSHFGNPSSIHSFGRKARAHLEAAREQFAQAIGCEDPDQIIFTGSATESINTVLRGFFAHAKAENKKVGFIVSAVEHEAVLETVKDLEAQGAKLSIVKVNSQGALDLAQYENLLKSARERGEAILVSLMAANNETGVVFPWQRCAELAKEYGAQFHLDAVQALGKISGFQITPDLGAASFSGHKIGGPKGVGALYLKKGFKLQALLTGGAQERKRRAGTVAVGQIMAMGAAAESLANRNYSALEQLRDFLESEVQKKIDGVSIQGQGAPRLGNTSNLLFSGVRGEGLVVGLDLEGFAVSSGSACNSGSILPSHVLLAMGLDKEAAQSAVRVSLGPQNTQGEILEFISALSLVVERIRAKHNAKLSASPAAAKY